MNDIHCFTARAARPEKGVSFMKKKNLTALLACTLAAALVAGFAFESASAFGTAAPQAAARGASNYDDGGSDYNRGRSGYGDSAHGGRSDYGDSNYDRGRSNYGDSGYDRGRSNYGDSRYAH